MKNKLKKLFDNWLFCMIITNLVIILVVTIWNLYHCYGMMIYGDSLAEATYFFWKVEIVDNAVALFVFDTYAIARKVIKLIKK